MKKWAVIFIFLQIWVIGKAQAESQNACAIWLCLPGGFPKGCASAYDEFRSRIEHGKPPLPDLSSCVVGPDRKQSNGTYQIGTEFFEPCKSGFAVDQEILNGLGRAICKPTSSQCLLSPKYRKQKMDCIPYNALMRSKFHYVKMWVEGRYLGQFFY